MLAKVAANSDLESAISNTWENDLKYLSLRAARYCLQGQPACFESPLKSKVSCLCKKGYLCDWESYVSLSNEYPIIISTHQTIQPM